ncbi:GFA family protein [Marinobacterium maritimum]|uniref:GFA family protein n=1 Tax=Marinobacterium maritimum TaxID=500162 RepID=A0ABN1I2W8_9GAMM
MEGQCLCGQVKFELTGNRFNLYQCHCSLCRKQGGAGANAATLVPDDHFQWRAGEELIRTYTRDTGFRSDFCSCCGSPVPNPLRGTGLYWVPAGLLDGELDGEIVAHLHTDSKANWEVLPAGGAHFGHMPDLARVMALLHGEQG